MIEGDKVIDILNNFFVKCLCCKKKFEINKDCFDYSSSSEERSMGPEITYEYETECNCPECDNAIKVNITAIEYPVGGLNYSKNEILYSSCCWLSYFIIWCCILWFGECFSKLYWEDH